MVIVVDENIDIAVIKRLREDGHDVFSIAESMPSVPDEEIFQVFLQRKALFLTEDKDFVEMIFHRKAYHYGIILVRLDGCLPEDKAEITSISIKAHCHELSGAIAALTPNSIRIRKFNF